MREPWQQTALDPPRAHGPPLGSGSLRSQPEDFVVDEELGFAPAGAGQHVLLRVRKREANTQWIARELAKACPCRPSDVGYAGLKDRHAVAVQWFTVPRSGRSAQSWTAVRGPDYEVLEAYPHTRKLPRGALAGNRFEIRIRQVSVDPGAFANRMERIAHVGVPNYFGAQRFGREGANLRRITLPLSELRPPERGFVLSAARGLIFNAVLAERVSDGSWASPEPGDLLNLDGSGSYFPVAEMDPSLRERCERLDVHPTGPMWGCGEPGTGGRIAELEGRVAATLSSASELVRAAAMSQERRSLRVAVRELWWSCEAGQVALRFRLGRGSFATTVLREIFSLDPAENDPLGGDRSAGQFSTEG